MKFSLLIVSLLISLINGKYLLVEVDGNANKPTKPIWWPKDSRQCNSYGNVISNEDNCNYCSCVDDGVCTKVGFCTEMECLDDVQKKEGEMCSVESKNCAKGLMCQSVKDICEKRIGRCVRLL